MSEEPNRDHADETSSSIPPEDARTRHAADTASDPTAAEGGPPTARQRWLAAVAYLGPGFLIPMFSGRPRGDFVRWHTQQGFVLFFVEAVLLALVVIFDQTLGRIPILGFLVMIVVELVAFVAALVASILGFVKALAGERYRFPVLEDYAERIPVED